ncbi:MAG: alpha/beta fold hydrolase, partial [Chloroflexota bacterium]
LLIGLLIITSVFSTSLAQELDICSAEFYENPQQRYAVPLMGNWHEVETGESFTQFMLADPVIEMSITIVEADMLETGVGLALEQVGYDLSTLTQETILDGGVIDNDPWTYYVYTDTVQNVIVAMQQVETTIFTVIAKVNSNLVYNLPQELILVLSDFVILPSLSPEWLPTIPSSFAEFDDINNIEFYSGGEKLIGTLTLPQGEPPFPAVVLVHGSGPAVASDFTEEARNLSSAGFAVLRYDKRGVGRSEGLFTSINRINSEIHMRILADDALAAVEVIRNLEEINADQVGLYGISQAGWIIPLAAARSDSVAFTVTWVGPTTSWGITEYFTYLTTGVGIRTSEIESISAQLATYEGCHGANPRESLETMDIPGWWYYGMLDGRIPAAESITILEEMISEYDKDFTITIEPSGTHNYINPIYREIANDWMHSILTGE